MPKLEVDAMESSMSERLLQGAQRAKCAWDGRAESENFLRADQNSVYADFLEYLWETATEPSEDGHPPMSRIVQPPRTGKTVIASQIVAGTGLTATVIVPSRVLIKQTVDEMRRWLTGVPIGTFYGENKDVVEHGVNVATYAILQQRMKNGSIPPPISSSALVFADEGHQSMTAPRQNVLQNAFASDAIRIALTATPDYSEDKALCRFFPDLIHEITFDEAIRLNLLAPYRFWLGEVDVSGSRVRVFAGDYVDDDIGKLMSEAPFFKAVELFRYAERNRRLGALICCATREQATLLAGYLKLHRPADLPVPQLILGNTPEEERDSILRRFERGSVDTIINVGVLIQGWNSRRCKLLIDLAPSTSRVRAAQKFSRPLTKDGDKEARIVMFVPKELPVMPLLPVELFGNSLTSYTAGEIIGSRMADGTKTAEEAIEISRTPIKDVVLKSRMVFTQTHRQPKLDPQDMAAVRSVLESCPGFNPRKPPKYSRFRWLEFRHELFQGRGLQLLRHLGFHSVRNAYFNFLSRTYPDGAALKYLLRHSRYKNIFNLDEERPPDVMLKAWHEECLGDPESEDSAIDRIDGKLSLEMLSLLTPIEDRIIRWRFGLDDGNELLLEEIGAKYNLSRERVRCLQEQALGKIRKRIAFLEKDEGTRKPFMVEKERVIPTLDEQIAAYGMQRYRELLVEIQMPRTCKEIGIRLAELGLPDSKGLQAYLTTEERRAFITELEMRQKALPKRNHWYYLPIDRYLMLLHWFWRM